MYKQKLLMLVAFLLLVYGINLLSMSEDEENDDFNFFQGKEFYNLNKLELARCCLKIANDAGCAKASIYLCMISLKLGNLNEFHKWRKIALQQINPQISYELGLLLEQRNEIQEAIKCYELASAKGLGASENRLGLIYHELKNKNRAIYHFKIAINRGFICALYNLGICYHSQDLEKAKKYFESAANHGYSLAQHTLGMIYLDENNLKAAKKNFKPGAKSGDIDSLYNLGVIAEREGKLQKAMIYYNKASIRGCTESQAILDHLQNEIKKKSEKL